MAGSSHRPLALLAFLVLCILPTVGVVYIIVDVNRPEYASEIADGLSRRFGLSAELSDIRYPRPGEAIYRDLVFRHPRDGRLVA